MAQHIKLPLETPALHIRIPELEFQLYFQFWLPANVYLGRQEVMAQILGFLLPTWEALVEILARGFGLLQP